MIRTQISLDKDEYDLANAAAAALGISFAEFVRRAVRERLPVLAEGAWMKYAGFVESGDASCAGDTEGHGWFLRLYDRHRAIELLAFIDAVPDLAV